MNYRVKNIGIAVGLAALAAILTSLYVVNYKRDVQHAEGKVSVLVASRDIPAGTSGADIVDQHLIETQTVLRKAVVAGNISSPDQLSRYVATQDIFQGEQISLRRFAPPKEQGVRSLIKGTQRAYQLPGDANQLLSGTLKEGDHVDVVGNWLHPEGGQRHVSRVVLRNVLVLKAPDAAGVTSKVGGSNADSLSVQLRVTDAQTQKLIWVLKNGDYYLTLRPPVNSLDNANTYQDSKWLLSDGPGRRIP
jgi:Flp pilus assembly protein CpaB